MVRLACIAVLASVFAAFASPIPANSVSAAVFDKRTTHTGRGTWFDVGLGACGETNVNSDSIVAISSDRWNGGGNCGQWVQVTNTANGNVAWGMTRDECPGCGVNDLDMSPGLFEQLGDLNTGVLSISWHFEAMGWSP